MQTTATTTTPTTPPPAPPKKTVASDYDTFLKMLTTQMQNQDPLNPIDSADYAVQLATFSGVEQQTKTNQLLESMGEQFQILGMSQLAGWIGQEARSTAPVLMDGDPVSITYAPKSGADQAVLVAKDAQGRVVSREDVPLSGAAYQWLGAGATGDPLPRGVYSLEVESYKEGQKLGTSGTEAYARILEARNSPQGVTMILEGGVEITSAQISALRAAGGL